MLAEATSFQTTITTHLGLNRLNMSEPRKGILVFKTIAVNPTRSIRILLDAPQYFNVLFKRQCLDGWKLVLQLQLEFDNFRVPELVSEMQHVREC